MKISLIAVTMCLAVSTSSQAACWDEAGARYNIDPILLQAMAHVESGMNAAARNYNNDGSYDVGLMQINKLHFPRLATFGITEKRLIAEPCTSVMVGAWILAEFVQRVGYNWTAVGAYNAGTSIHRKHARNRYIKKVAGQYRALKMQTKKRTHVAKVLSGKSTRSFVQLNTATQ
ncbi:transglycosylase SLT domain-containing protein [Glaciimonas sp. Gout2]|uniref:transglycosylase SLT domain-containing protein n=1 Tax=unclassified Glaciimonas TaxID=2644401 RepID=UPI002AB5990A|nr:MULTISPECIES: transglycosylase SLT domain-containing protein [unclassified Glaciimonas]MDY7548524.1 transglycosylase SLT domain-containing protein [Glaciimonas sp. CA11.2]MEB0013711.1 transglycosylase SLT domain-containing protein [Glaciimonas sp. Cout2]MEB0084869.1 transglycosylase SLT domain-containing protein [Glaciimonas sp. Gout2]